MAGIDAVIFDWGGTLTPWHTIDPVAAWRATALLLDEARAEEVGGRLVEAERRLWQRAREEHRSATMDELFALAEVVAAEDVLDRYYTSWDPHTYTDPDVPDLFRGLRERGIGVGVLSNTIWPRRYHERIFRRDGVFDLIDAAVYTSEIPWTKPHPEAFRAALDAVGAKDPARAVYVGDRLFDDVWGAQQVGMRAVLMPHSDIPTHERGHTEGVPDAVINRLSDLLPIIDSWRRSSRNEAS